MAINEADPNECQEHRLHKYFPQAPCKWLGFRFAGSFHWAAMDAQPVTTSGNSSQASFEIIVRTCSIAQSLFAALALQESFLDEGFILDKRIGVGQPKRIENATILVANTAMDTDKIKIYGARVRVDSMQKVSCLNSLSSVEGGVRAVS